MTDKDVERELAENEERAEAAAEEHVGGFVGKVKDFFEPLIESVEEIAGTEAGGAQGQSAGGTQVRPQ